MQMKTEMRYHHTPVRMTTIKKKITKNNKCWEGYEEDVEKLEPLCTVERIVKWCNCYGKQYGGSSEN